MKDQYFGDRTDYIKYGVLRRLSNAGFKLGIHWTWTPDDGSSDGSRTRYLVDHHLWREYDPEVFDTLAQYLAKGTRRLRIVQEEDLIPGALHCFDEWTSCPEQRGRSLNEFLRRLTPGSLVFFDPDNGIEVSSVSRGSANARKYVFLEELSSVWSYGHSIIVYQHFPRVKRLAYVAAQLGRLSRRLSSPYTAAITTSHVAFLCCFHPQHAECGTEALAATAHHWSPHTQAYLGSEKTDRGVECLMAPQASKGQQELPL